MLHLTFHLWPVSHGTYNARNIFFLDYSTEQSIFSFMLIFSKIQVLELLKIGYGVRSKTYFSLCIFLISGTRCPAVTLFFFQIFKVSLFLHSLLVSAISSRLCQWSNFRNIFLRLVMKILFS